MSSPVEKLIEDTKWNAVGSWILILTLTAFGGYNFHTGDLVYAGFAAFIVLLSIIPVFSFQNAWALPPWELLFLASIPFIGLNFYEIPARYFSYLSAAGVAMIVAVELHYFTDLKMNDFFAVVFVTMTTVASAAVWALVRWFSDIYLNTSFLVNHDVLMWEFVLATFSGIIAGIAFDLYFEHYVSDEMYDEVVESY